MSYRRAVDEDGNELIYRSATDSEGNKQWIQYPVTSVPEKDLAELRGTQYTAPDTSTQPGRRERIIEARKINRAAEDQRDWEEAVKAGPAYYNLKKYAREEMGPLERFAVSGMRETQKLGAGAADLIDITRGMFGEDIEANMARRNKRKEEQQLKDLIDAPLESETKGLESTGKVIPYLLSGRYASAPAEKAAEKIFDLVSSGIKTPAVSIGSEAAGIIEKGKKSSNPVIKQLSEEVDTGVIKPIKDIATGFKNQPAIVMPFRKGLKKDIGGAAILGGAEGALHYDESALTGASESTLGNVLGRWAGRYLERSPYTTDPLEKEVLDWWAAPERKYRVDAGQRTGLPHVQEDIAAMRKDPRWSAYMKQYDEANEKVVNRVAAEAIGMDKNTDYFTPSMLDAHRKSLRDEYKQLEANTKARYTNKDLTELGNVLSEVPKESYKKIKTLYDDLIDLTPKPSRGQGGRFQKGSIAGTDYQRMRQKLKDARDTSYNNGRVEEYKSIDNMIKFLDKSLERGMEEVGGTALAKQWKDLNERYAMTSLLLDKGLTPLGKVDMSRLSSELINNDSRRLLLDEGNRIKSFHKIAKLNEIKKNQEKPGLGDRTTDDSFGIQGHKRNILSTPASTDTSALAQILAAAKVKGYPSELGILNIPRGSVSPLARSAAQAYDLQNPTLGLINYLLEGQAIDDTRDSIKNWWEE